MIFSSLRDFFSLSTTTRASIFPKLSVKSKLENFILSNCHSLYLWTQEIVFFWMYMQDFNSILNRNPTILQQKLIKKKKDDDEEEIQDQVSEKISDKCSWLGELIVCLQ